VDHHGIEEIEEQLNGTMPTELRSWSAATDLIEEGRVVRRQPKAALVEDGWSFAWRPGEDIVAAGPSAPYGPFRMYAKSGGQCGAFCNASPAYSHHLNLSFLEGFYKTQSERLNWKLSKRPRGSFAHEMRRFDSTSVEILSVSPAPPEVPTSYMRTLASSKKAVGTSSSTCYAVDFPRGRPVEFEIGPLLSASSVSRSALDPTASFTTDGFSIVLKYDSSKVQSVHITHHK
jgi:hypothetical protein